MLADYLDSPLHVTRSRTGQNGSLPGPPGKICDRVMFQPEEDASE
jgi:hypothetical protein